MIKTVISATTTIVKIIQNHGTPAEPWTAGAFVAGIVSVPPAGGVAMSGAATADVPAEPLIAPADGASAGVAISVAGGDAVLGVDPPLMPSPPFPGPPPAEPPPSEPPPLLAEPVVPPDVVPPGVVPLVPPLEVALVDPRPTEPAAAPAPDEPLLPAEPLAAPVPPATCANASDGAIVKARASNARPKRRAIAADSGAFIPDLVPAKSAPKTARLAAA
jgi:hypothetical protein